MERDSLENQVQALTAYGTAQGVSLRLYREEGVSAKDTERPALKRLLEDVRANRVEAVVVTKLDRISRSLHDLLELMATFETYGVKFVSLRDNIDTAGPVGRFMLHILGAIAELERGITAERVAEDMKLRAQRGKWNGGLAPFGRQMQDGRLAIVPEEAAVLHRMRELLLERRTWRGVAVGLNREGFRTRGWDPLERDGRTVRRGHRASEWTPWSVKRVLLQPVNEGTLVYNRRRVKGRVHVARPVEEHITVTGFCEPIFTPEQMAEARQVAREIERTPSRELASEHLLSGLVFCTCGTKMYGISQYTNTKLGRYRSVYYRCRRASAQGTCSAKQIPASVIEPLLIGELWKLRLNPGALDDMAGEATGAFEEQMRPLLKRAEESVREIQRVERRLEALLELAEERLIGKEEYATRRSQLEAEHTALHATQREVEQEIAARAQPGEEIRGVLAGLERLLDVFESLDEVGKRRRMLHQCLSRVIVRQESLEVHVMADPVILPPDDSTDDAAELLNISPKIPGKVHLTSSEGHREGAQKGAFWG